MREDTKRSGAHGSASFDANRHQIRAASHSYGWDKDNNIKNIKNNAVGIGFHIAYPKAR
ncbi:MAG: hypothetical protein IKS94_07190 [Prevotella sp.]|nr:hypothetical protein [Prevotella sp.]